MHLQYKTFKERASRAQELVVGFRCRRELSYSQHLHKPGHFQDWYDGKRRVLGSQAESQPLFSKIFFTPEPSALPDTISFCMLMRISTLKERPSHPFLLRVVKEVRF